MYEKLNRFEQIIFDVCSVILVVFYSWAAVVQPMATQYHRGIYVIVTYLLVFLLYKSKSIVGRIIDYTLIVLSVASIGYWIVMFEIINYRTGAETTTDMVFAVIGVLIGIELARRVVGNVFVIIGCVMLGYGVYGDYMPDLISHAGDTFPALCTSIFYKSDGIFGIMANVLATYVILFVLFGAFLEKCGAQKFFIDWPLAAVGHKIGGPGKVSVIASGLFGSISGSAIANTVSTGAFTIPPEVVSIEQLRLVMTGTNSDGWMICEYEVGGYTIQDTLSVMTQMRLVLRAETLEGGCFFGIVNLSTPTFTDESGPIGDCDVGSPLEPDLLLNTTIQAELECNFSPPCDAWIDALVTLTDVRVVIDGQIVAVESGTWGGVKALFH